MMSSMRFWFCQLTRKTFSIQKIQFWWVFQVASFFMQPWRQNSGKTYETLNFEYDDATEVYASCGVIFNDIHYIFGGAQESRQISRWDSSIVDFKLSTIGLMVVDWGERDRSHLPFKMELVPFTTIQIWAKRSFSSALMTMPTCLITPKTQKFATSKFKFENQNLTRH